MLDGRRYFLSSADYPYFRDDPANWLDRLEKLKALGCQVVTFYIPWRHHDLLINGKRQLDLTGRTKPNRNVTGFINLMHSVGMKAIVKPGPFVHSELNYGGLPDFVCPLINSSIEPMLGGDGKPFVWGGNEVIEGGLIGDKPVRSGLGLKPWPLPAPLDPTFQREMRGWFDALREHVFRFQTYPDGPIIMAQLGNEGIYSNHQRAPWAYDYSRSGLAFYQIFLKERYGDLETYNRRHDTDWTDWLQIKPPRERELPSSLPDSLRYADWSEFQAVYMGHIYRSLIDAAGLNLPYILNVNPPTRDHFGADAWLSRINPDVWSGVHYGFTNWIGVACDDEDVVDRYQLMVHRDRGFNLEENWGFSRLYEEEFGYEAVSFYQTILAIASGGTGYNIYTGIGTDQADEDMDSVTRGEYPDCAPIDASGRLSAKTKIVSLMNTFFNHWGEDFLQTHPVRPVAWGLYLPYAHTAVWAKEQDRQVARRLGLPECGRSVLTFFRQMRRSQIDADLINLQAVSLDKLQSVECLALEVGAWMDCSTQQKLCQYVKGGGKLVLFGSGPKLDETYTPFNGLAEVEDRIYRLPLDDLQEETSERLLRLIGLNQPLLAQNQAAADSNAWLFVHPEKDVQFLFVLAGKKQSEAAEWIYRANGNEHGITVRLPGSGAGVVRIEDGRLSAALVKGWNDYRNERVVPSIRINEDFRCAEEAGDWLLLEA